MKRVAPLFFLLSACATIPRANLSAEDRLAVETFKESWKEAGRGSLRECYIDQVRVLHTTSRMQFLRECGAYPEDAAECTAQVVVRTKGVPKIVLAPGQPSIDTTSGPVIHGLIHWGAGCVDGNRDNAHQNDELWRAPGVSEEIKRRSVQGRARSKLYPGM